LGRCIFDETRENLGREKVKWIFKTQLCLGIKLTWSLSNMQTNVEQFTTTKNEIVFIFLLSMHGSPDPERSYLFEMTKGSQDVTTVWPSVSYSFPIVLDYQENDLLRGINQLKICEFSLTSHK
jgi:hypothetical protein